MAPKVENRYILFTGEVHESVKFVFTIQQIGTFIAMWNQGCPINEIAQKLNSSKVSVALIAMDLEMAGRIGPRAGGLLGKRKVVS
ncbi:hypothetical protein [Lysinibacillus fusiformis]|uniref:hypothetical protein n=1 Tax=Lysinibacillus fusiformis TaxID=28031 RepID=UPI00187F7686|nr:hypothetical protein [Lysinibacillus fusiformis]MBD8522365.1 hypothetical protein [Lysinibacillus fusiformis]